MKSLVRLSAVSALLLFALAADAAVPTLSSPANDACLATLKGSTTEEGSHKWFFYGKTAAERKALMNGGANATLRAKMGNTYGDHPKATTFSWSGAGPFTLTIKRRDGSVFLEKSGIAGTALSVDNFEIAASYIWTVSNADGTSTPRAFTTEDTVPRLLNGSSQVDYTQGSVTTKVPHGVRDMGGYIGLDGRRARQGLLIRNSAFESDANSSGEAAGMKIKYIDDTNRPFWNEFIKVRTELDLRNNSESTLVQSTLGSGVTYKRFANLPAWKKYMTGTYATNFKKDVKGIFSYLADAGRYPISFHCTHGKDRTGMLAFLIGSVLGYSESDIYADYEATIFWHPTQGVSLETSDANGFVDYLNDSMASGVTGATIQEKAVNFIKSCGVTDIQLEVFREIMLEPIEEDEPDEPPPAPVEPEAPDGVDVYDYLQTDGRGYVLTDYTPNLKKTMIEFKVTLLDATVSHGLYVANACTKGDKSCTSQMILVLQPSDGTVRYFNQATGDDKSAEMSGVEFDVTEEHVVRTFGDTVWYDDRTAQVEGYVETDAKVGGPLQLLAENFSEPRPVCQTYARVAYIKAWEIDGTVTNLVRKWVPAKDANGVATLYEVVNGKYEAVSGSGAAFAVGMNGPARAQNAWTVAPSFTPLAYAAGTAPTFVLGESLYGTPVATYPAARLAKLDGGTYTQTVSVAATDAYMGLSTDFVFTVTGNLPRTPTVVPGGLSPDGETVALHTDRQKAFLALSRAERRANYTDSRWRAELAAGGSAPKPVTLAWTGNGACTVTVTRKRDQKVVFLATLVDDTVDVWNLEINTEYTWTVVNALGTAKGAFTTEDEAPRLLRDPLATASEGVRGIRDLGGRVGLDGRRVRQGRVFRCSQLNRESSFIADGNRGFYLDELGIKTDLDFRSGSQLYGITSSPLGPSVAFVNAQIGSYTGLFDSPTAFKKTFDAFLDEANYPIVFHCAAGQDRTGVVAFLLNAILGVDEEELIKDWEVTAFWNGSVDFCHANLDKFYETLATKANGGETVQEQAVNAVLNTGYTMADVEKFRALMLEPEEEPGEDGPTVAPMENPAWGYVIGGLGETADETAYVFTNTTAAMSWTAPLGVSSVELLVVGGGGAGGDNHPSLSIGGGGGGAGGYVYSKAHAVTGNQSYSVSVGAGAKTAAAKTGGDSAFGDVTAKGGGCGGVLSVGQAGGSGGGSSGKKGSSAKYAGGTGIAGQGFVGGSGDGWWKSNHVDSGTGGGGGGAGSKGGDAPNDEQGGIGGAGKTCAITGEEIVYCAGGGGGTDSHNRTPNDERGCYNGIGGVGAGDGGDGNCMNGGDATGYGCGGGGAAGNRDAGQTGGRGFQGIVVVRCAKPAVEVVIGEMVGLAKSGQSVLPADAAVESVEIAADGRSFTWGGRTYEKPHYLFARDGETVIVRIDPAEAAVRSMDADGANDTFVIGTVLQSVVGFDYSVSYADDLLTQPEGWDRTEPVAGTGGPLELKAPKSGPQRFYRLVVGDGVQ